VDAAVASMVALNREAAAALATLPAGSVHACTDVTGFGLVGHGSEMAAASGVTLRIDAAAVPFLEGASSLVEGNVPGGGRTNAQHFGPGVRFEREIDAGTVQLLHDPQTSGGLLAAVAPSAAEAAVRALTSAGAGAHVVGQAVEPAGCRILLF
jgi:selenide, water dikinase